MKRSHKREQRVEVGELLGIDKTAAHRAVEAAGLIERRHGLPQTMRVVEARGQKNN